MATKASARREWFLTSLAGWRRNRPCQKGRRLYSFILLFGLVGSLALQAIGAQAESNDVDLALVLAIDTSGSVSPNRYDLQRKGYAEAFASQKLISAIRSAPNRVIAVTLVEWSGAHQQEQVIGWTLIRDESSSKAFSESLKKIPRSFYGRTSISAAIDFSVTLIMSSPFQSARKVIDVSGDGSSNDGRPVTDARDDAVAVDLTINGLPILVEEADLGDYYRKYVIGGPDSFVIEVVDYSHFSEAILKKLIREVA
jgi:hypothetical protein